MKRILLAACAMAFVFAGPVSANNHWLDPERKWVNKWDYDLFHWNRMEVCPKFLEKLRHEPSAAKRMKMREAYFAHMWKHHHKK